MTVWLVRKGLLVVQQMVVNGVCVAWWLRILAGRVCQMVVAKAVLYPCGTDGTNNALAQHSSHRSHPLAG